MSVRVVLHVASTAASTSRPVCPRSILILGWEVPATSSLMRKLKAVRDATTSAWLRSAWWSCLASAMAVVAVMRGVTAAVQAGVTGRGSSNLPMAADVLEKYSPGSSPSFLVMVAH